MVQEGTVNAALKEWAIVCEALADGRQTLLIRKGGILEVKDGFDVTHRSFWLFPTYAHQNTADLVPSVREEFRFIQATEPASGVIPIRLYATVEDVLRVTELESLRRLEGQHVLSWECVASRFHYRNKPGVHLLILRVHRRPEPIPVQNQSWYDGCVSWVELDQPLDVAGCVPVLTDADFTARVAAIRRQIAGREPTARGGCHDKGGVRA
jgi:hypothetical protein